MKLTHTPNCVLLFETGTETCLAVVVPLWLKIPAKIEAMPSTAVRAKPAGFQSPAVLAAVAVSNASSPALATATMVGVLLVKPTACPTVFAAELTADPAAEAALATAEYAPPTPAAFATV